MPVEIGSGCEKASTKFYFDTQAKVCYPFDYTGCGPELTNRFDTNEDCNNICNENKTANTSTVVIEEKSKYLICLIKLKWYNLSR